MLENAKSPARRLICSVNAPVATLVTLESVFLSKPHLPPSTMFSSPLCGCTTLYSAIRKATMWPMAVAIAAPTTPSLGKPKFPLISR